MKVRFHSLLRYMDKRMWKVTLLPTVEIGRRQASYATDRCNWVEFTWLFWTIIVEFGFKEGGEE